VGLKFLFVTLSKPLHIHEFNKVSPFMTADLQGAQNVRNGKRVTV